VRLRAEADVYDTTCMVVAEWDDPFDTVQIRNDVTPADLRADRFLASMVECVLNRTPVAVHVRVRERHEHRSLPLEELSDEELPD
jgi:hypothetical protein